jgi:hypothetical protein
MGRVVLTAGLWLEPADYHAWRQCLDLERRAGHLTLHRKLALETLLTFGALEDADGLFPSDEAVAERAGISARTVRRARKDAREMGLLTWARTRKMVDGQWRQGPNQYSIKLPDTPVCDIPGGQRAPRMKKVSKTDADREVAVDNLEARQANERIRAERDAVLNAKWRQRRAEKAAILRGLPPPEPPSSTPLNTPQGSV